MNSLSRFIILTTLLFAGGGALQAQAVRSPFMPPSAAAPEETAAVVQDAELQFCGVFGDGANKRFLIYNVTTKRSSWLRMDQEGPEELFVEGYDAEQGTVNVRQGSRSLTLGLQAATIAGGGGSGGSAPVTLAGNSQDLVKTVKVNPTPSDERRRLEAVAAEVRRRRAARQAAAANAPQPGNPR